jgi:hypothetical protein
MNPIATPTPYAFEALAPRITAINPSDWGIWNYTDEAINIWNYNSAVGAVIQTAVIIILVSAFVMLLMREFNRIQNRE